MRFLKYHCGCQSVDHISEPLLLSWGLVSVTKQYTGCGVWKVTSWAGVLGRSYCGAVRVLATGTRVSGGLFIWTAPISHVLLVQACSPSSCPRQCPPKALQKTKPSLHDTSSTLHCYFNIRIEFSTSLINQDITRSRISVFY